MFLLPKKHVVGNDFRDIRYIQVAGIVTLSYLVRPFLSVQKVHLKKGEANCGLCSSSNGFFAGL